MDTGTLQGLRVGPLDPSKKDGSKAVGTSVAAKTQDDNSEQTLVIKKNRTGFSGGFKVPEEYRQKLQGRKKKKRDDSLDDDADSKKDQSLITKDEILAHLNLAGADMSASGKYGGTGKAGITKELVEGLEKDLEKLKRTEELYKNRLHFQKTGQNLLEETEEDREEARIAQIKADAEEEGAHVIHADEQRLMMMRH